MAILAFQKPDKVIMQKSTDFDGQFEFRPLEPGFGVTIGNALRRILLSSLEGFAITSIRFSGVSHEFSTMKGVVEEFFEKVGLHKKETYDPNAGKNFLHPGRQANIVYDGKVVGYMGEVHPEVADIYGIGERAYVAVIDMPQITELATFERKYEGIAKYPAVSRDISMVMPKSILVGQVEEVIENKGGAYLESYKLFDIYEGAQIKAGFKSVAYSITFRAKDKTLEEADISAAMNRILKALEEMGIELRK